MNQTFEVTKEVIDELLQAINSDDGQFISNFLDQLHTADVDTVFQKLNTNQAKYCFNFMNHNAQADLISFLDQDIRVDFLKNFSSKSIASFIEQIDSDDATDILNEQSPKTREEIISLISPEKSNAIRDLLRYDENSAGGLMAKELVKCHIDWNVGQCREEIRRLSEVVENVFSVYVVDDKGVLLGWVPMKSLLLTNGSVPLKEIYVEEIISIRAYKNEEVVAEIMQKYDLESIPVVDMLNNLLGRITIDDVVDVITEMAERERQIMSGVSQNVESKDSIWAIAKSRLPWLTIGMFGGLLAAQVMGFFDEELAQIPAMAFFIPLIMATGGNVGIQASSLVVQSIADRSFNEEDKWKDLMKSLLVSLVNGLVISVLVFLFNVLINGDVRIAFVVANSLFFVVILASLMGTITPLVLNRFKVNPALASGPFITTCNDLLGIAVYFLTARLLFN